MFLPELRHDLTDVQVMIIGAVIQGAANGIAMYLIARWLLGFGIPMCIVAASSLLGELGYPKERPILTSLFNASYMIGSILAAGISFGTQQMSGNWYLTQYTSHLLLGG